MTVDELFVIWRAPADGTKHVVGRVGGSAPYWFRYEAGLADARAAGFPGLPEFSLEGPAVKYESSQLFSTFRHRIPSPRRPDFKRLLGAWGASESTAPLELLAKNGGFLLTDRLELAEFREIDDDLSRPLEFRVAGQKHYDDPETVLSVGEAVTFRREATNPHDPFAVEVLLDDRKLGYVPRQYSQMFASLLQRGAELLGQTTRALLVPGEPHRWVITARAAPRRPPVAS